MSSTTIPEVSRIDPGGTLVGRTIGKYRIVRMIGRGGMGRVYEAVNVSIHKRVAMKLIDHELAKNEEANARFQREALAASAVESPYIVQIFDAGQTDEGVPFIVMELLRGRDLGSVLKSEGRLSLDQALMMAAQVLKGLHHAHAAGIVHRDLKPDNVFLVEREDEPVTIKLLDFGVSKIARHADSPLKTLTRQGTVVGTPYYMSPEQAQAFPDVDGRTDLYSVGAILYECLTGRTPVEGQSYEQVIVNICVKDVPDVRKLCPMPDGVAALIHRALSREREARYPSARDMLQALAASAPESLRGSMPSGQLRISGQPSLPAVAEPGELADTVNLAALPRVDAERPEELQQSGISTRSGAGRAAPLDEDAVVTPSRRWPIAVGAGVALLLGGALYLGFGTETPPAQESNVTPAPEPPPLASEPVAEPPVASIPASAVSSAPSSRPPLPAVKPPSKPIIGKPAPAPPAPSPVPSPAPSPAPEGLELLPR